MRLPLLQFIALYVMTDAENGEKVGGILPQEEEDEYHYYDENANIHPLTDMPRDSPDVISSGLLIDKGPYHLGYTLSGVVGIVNNGIQAINITRIMGSVNSRLMFDYYYQNLTLRHYNMILHEGEETSLRYPFNVSPILNSDQYRVALTVFYENDEEYFSDTFFNDTVPFSHKDYVWLTESNILKFCGVFCTILLFIISWYLITNSKQNAINSKKRR